MGLGFLQQKPYFGQQMSPENRVSSRLEPKERVLKLLMQSGKIV